MHLVSKLLLLAAAALPTVMSHGFLKSPRSRNLVAFQDGVDSSSGGGTSVEPIKEYCPHCLNRGGTLAACGTVDGRNYDFPKNILGGDMPDNIQATLTKGGTIDIEVVLTAHHKGHFSFYACPVTTDAGQRVVPTESCFKANPLEFVQDLLYAAPKDPSHPDRAYIPPIELSQTDNTGPTTGWLYRYRMKLPENIQGDLVLLQWHYITGNSCTAAGTRNYNLPSSWGDLGYDSIPECAVIPADGNGAPEQFWNCAEVFIHGNSGGLRGGTPSPAPSTTEPSLSPPTSSLPTTVSTSSAQTPCGNGSRGNGICADGTCCSDFGWCGTGDAYCSGNNQVVVVVGTCGNGVLGNGICADGNCCSEFGWCGTSDAHCSGTCGNGSRGNGRCADGTCCSPYGWCGTSPAYCG